MTDPSDRDDSSGDATSRQSTSEVSTIKVEQGAYALRRLARWLWRWLRRVLLGFVGIVLLLLTILVVLQWTAPGRELVRGLVVAQVSELIPGSLEVTELEQLSPWGVELRGATVRDPAGEVVLTLEHAAVQIDLSRIVSGTIAASEFQIQGGWVDLRRLEERRGLVAAFVDPEAPESPPSSGPPPHIVVEQVVADDVRVRLPEVKPLGQVDAVLERLRGRFELLDGSPIVRVEQLRLLAFREQEKLAQLALEGSWQPGDEPSSLSVELSALGMDLAVSARGVPPTRQGWHDEPAQASLIVSGVTAERLGRLLRIEELERAFLGEASLELEASGTPRQPMVDGALTTAAGSIVIDRASARDDTLLVELSTSEFRLAALRRDLPERTVGFELRARAQGFPPDPAKVSVDALHITVDGAELGDLSAQALVTSNGARELSVTLSQGGTRFHATGDVDFDGTARVSTQFDLRRGWVRQVAGLLEQDVSGRARGYLELSREATGVMQTGGRVNLDDARWREQRVASAELRFQLRGQPPDLHGLVELEASDADLGRLHLDSARLEAKGKLQELSVEVAASGRTTSVPDEGPRARSEQFDLQLEGLIERGASSTSFTGSGGGTLADRSVDFDVQRSKLGDDGELFTEGMALELAGQEIRLEGSFGEPTSDGLRVRIGPVDLGKLAEATGLNLPLTGQAELEALLQGTPQAPRIGFTGQLLQAGIEHRPLVDSELSGKFDADRGIAELELTLSRRSETEAAGLQALQARVEASGRFRAGPNYLANLPQADVDVDIEVERLTVELLRSLLGGAELPVQGEMRSRLKLSGNIDQPELHAVSRASLRNLAGAQPVEAAHELHYVDGQLDSELRVDDASGRWIELDGQLALSGEARPAPELPAALVQALSEGQWRLSVSTQPRQLSEMFLAESFLGPELPPVSVGLRATANKQAEQREPQVDLLLRALQTEDDELAGCNAGRGLWLELDAKHRGRRNDATVLLRQGADQLLQLDLAAEKAFSPLLRGQGADFSDVSLELQTRQLDLAKVPFVCGRAKGVASLSVSGRDVAGREPLIEFEGQVDGFSLGGRHALDVELLARASSEAARIDLRMQGRGEFESSAARLVANLPWRFGEGVVAIPDDPPLDGKLFLSHLPVAPLVPPGGPISYPRGMVDGRIRAGGTVGSPELFGELRLEGLAFTSTALAQPLRDIEGRIAFHGRRVEIPYFEAHDRDGRLNLKGYVDLNDMEAVEAKTRIVAENFPIRQAGQVVATTTLDATATTRVTPRRTEAKLVLREVDTWIESTQIRKGIDLQRHPEFIIDDAAPHGSSTISSAHSDRNSQGPAGPKQPAEGPVESKHPDRDAGQTPVSADTRRVTEIAIDAKQKFWVKREDFAVKLGAQLETSIEGEQVRVDGDVTIDRGYLQLFGKIFELERRSKLRFIGSNPPNPVLDIEAVNDSRGGKAVAVRITGRASAPDVAFFVAGDRVDGSVAVRELFGSNRQGSAGDASAQAQSFVGGLTAGVLATAARREFGAAAPIIMIDPAQQAGEGRVRAGFELDDVIPPFLQPIVTGVYLEGIVARESDGSARANTDVGALLEIYFPRHFFTAGQYGPGSTWSLDFGWQL